MPAIPSEAANGSRKTKAGARGESKETEALRAALNLPRVIFEDYPTNNITPSLRRLDVVPVDALVPDPDNARLHPEKNLKSIMESLCLYGQRKPLVVNRNTMIVEAGNGTLEAAKALGWTEVAVNYVEDDLVTAAGFGLADNKTAELAKWDYEVMARLDRLLYEADAPNVGMSPQELTSLRAGWLQAEGGASGGAGGRAEEVPQGQWQILVTCGGEGEQLALLEQLTEEGYPCRALTF